MVVVLSKLLGFLLVLVGVLSTPLLLVSAWLGLVPAALLILGLCLLLKPRPIEVRHTQGTTYPHRNSKSRRNRR